MLSSLLSFVYIRLNRLFIMNRLMFIIIVMSILRLIILRIIIIRAILANRSILLGLLHVIMLFRLTLTF